MRLAGLEPAAHGLGTRCSILLSYRRKKLSLAEVFEIVLFLGRRRQWEFSGSKPNSGKQNVASSVSQSEGLASYAMADAQTRGRRYPEPPHPYRSPYQRDRDRIVHTKAFRRLEKKTQVFAPLFSDHFRNRLTHTIEVSQIARTVASALRLNAELCEVLALSHDVGHPPFGHEGESVLNSLMEEFGSGFDHNLHALRIVEDFEEKYASFRGLNLTFEVREGIVKHSRDYRPDEDLYVDIREYMLDQRPPLEAQLIDVADEIAYNSADLDDGYDSGLLELGQMRGGSTLFDELYRDVESRHPSVPEKLRVSETIRRLIDHLVTNLLQSTSERLHRNNVRSVESVRSHAARLVDFDKQARDRNREIKEYLRTALYDHARVKRARRSVGRLLEELFRFYVAQPEKLPPGHFRRVGELPVQRVVCDYIAGMTDPFAEASHRRLVGP